MCASEKMAALLVAAPWIAVREADTKVESQADGGGGSSRRRHPKTRIQGKHLRQCQHQHHQCHKFVGDHVHRMGQMYWR